MEANIVSLVEFRGSHAIWPIVPQWGEVLTTESPRGQMPRWQIECIKDLLDLRRLPEDWDSYGSPPPDATAIDRAIDLILGIELEDFPAPAVSPVSGGSVQLEWNVDRHGLEIEVPPTGSSVEYLRTYEGDPIEEDEIDPRDLAARVKALTGWLLSA